MWIDFKWATDANVSSKSIHLTWVYPWATNLALFPIITPCSSDLFLKIHLVSIILWLSGWGSSHTSFLMNWFNYSYMILIWLSSYMESLTFLGSIYEK
jgi:hypothetical protein